MLDPKTGQLAPADDVPGPDVWRLLDPGRACLYCYTVRVVKWRGREGCTHVAMEGMVREACEKDHPGMCLFTELRGSFLLRAVLRAASTATRSILCVYPACRRPLEVSASYKKLKVLFTQEKRVRQHDDATRELHTKPPDTHNFRISKQF
ncbi:hypothetical protein E2C01_050552 [Portunus trituberculatus]|uniref:Uncharacterized protein n=1 Tax=Portunus trituberculatus TaxID=210409 RepID=A0A5B7GHU5_PORTR|nr:hypothetical protein [Portunus trituberculatus]